MTWFKVDDNLHSSAKAHAAGEAMALWVLAGSWCADQLTDGFIPATMVNRLMPRVGRRYAARLVAAGLWIAETRSVPAHLPNTSQTMEAGWVFHDWGHYQPSKEQIKAERSNAAERQKRARERAKSRRDSPVTNGVSHSVSHSVSHGPPDPTRENHGGESLRDSLPPRVIAEPPSRCKTHIDTPTDGPCRACGVARRQHDEWELGEGERRRTWQHCRTHRGQPAHNCAMCRSEALSPPEDDQ